MKKILLIICLLVLNGCTDYIEINELAIVTGIGIDYKDNMFDVTTQLITSQKDTVVEVFNTKSTTIEEALAEISKLSNRELFISDLKVLLLTDNIIKNNINYYDYFLRNSQSKMNFYVYSVKDDSIKDILNIYSEKEGSSLYIDKMMKFNERIFSSSTPLHFIDLVKDNVEYGINPVYPKMVIKENNDEKVLYLENLVTYNNSFERIDLNETNSIFYNIVTNNSNSTVLDIECGDNLFSLSLKNAKSTYSFDKTFNIDISVTSKINSYHCDMDLNDDKTMKKLKDLSNSYMKEQVEELINIVKKNNNDFLGLGDYIYRHNTDYFDFKNKDWDKYVNKLDIKVKTDISITSVGEARTSIGDKYGKNK